MSKTEGSTEKQFLCAALYILNNFAKNRKKRFGKEV